MTETFSFYRGGIWITTPEKEIDMPQLIELVRSGAYKAVVEHLRELRTREEQRELKRTSSDFDYVTFGGVFTSRGKDKLTRASGLSCHDIDNIGNPQETK